MPELGPDAAIYRGVEDVREAVGSWTRMWTEYTFEVRDYLDAGDDVVVLVRDRGRGRSSGAIVEREFGSDAGQRWRSALPSRRVRALTA
jgi:ketosteroid isomerase-like protein